MAYNIIISTNERRLFDDVLERRPRCRGDVHERDRLCSAAPSTIRASSRSPLRAWSHWKPQAILTSPRSYARTRSKSRLRQRRHARDDGADDGVRRNDGTSTSLMNHISGACLARAFCRRLLPHSSGGTWRTWSPAGCLEHARCLRRRRVPHAVEEVGDPVGDVVSD